MPEQPIPEQDPITSKSYALHYLIATVLLVGTLFWALWDEAYGQRPWKQFQTEFRTRYSKLLQQVRSQSSTSQQELQQSAEYQRLNAAYEQAVRESDARRTEIQRTLATTNDSLLAVQGVFTDRRAYVNYLTYELEYAHSESDKQSRQREIDEYKNESVEVRFSDGKTEQMNFNQLEQRYNSLRDEKTRLSAELGEILKPVNDAQLAVNTWISDRMVTLTPSQITGLQNRTESLVPDIRQINVAEANIVDRCESCHLGAREPVRITAASMTDGSGTPDGFARAFVSHPDLELLRMHDPEVFGCSTCHQGNGRATTSVEQAHGNYKHWLWPLFKKSNVEAGCQTCHGADMVLATTGGSGSLISEGKFLFRQRGCNGCHRYENYDREPEELLNVAQQIRQLETAKKDNSRTGEQAMREADDPNTTSEQASRLNTLAEAMRVANSKIDGQIEQLDVRSRSLLLDMKKLGPDLKEIRAKLNKNWLPEWIHKPTDFRPTTKMPNFRLNDQQLRSISAYLWQTALRDPLPQAPAGNAERGKELFETRGCLACHSISDGGQTIGGNFAADLSRVGEKVNYNYLFRWIKDPRQRSRPYCPYEKKDIGPEDYAKKGLPYVFDLEHTQCPNDGHELLVQQMTVMPDLRLPDAEIADIATYLMTRRDREPSAYAEASYLDDASLQAEGKKWVQHFGCAGCHEISGLEEEGRIGTELTMEGSKPIERLDFAILTHAAERGGHEPISDPVAQARLPEGPATGPWYNHKGFFEHKLAQPDIYDQGKIRTEEEKLRMPDPHLTKEQVQALTTFLLGSQETSLPASYQYKPEDARRDIQEGWWIVRKYNCVGCHQFTPGQKTALEDLPRYRSNPETLPPKLLTQGARVDPEWLLRFLSNPALSTNSMDRNGVRSYLGVRMPTFYFSQNELRKLVRFFQALSQQPTPYIPERQPLLTSREMDIARALFTSTAAPCLRCHATGDPVHDRTATAPNFLLVKERLKPGWTERWLLDPQSISPGTAMPSNLFRREGTRWVFSGPVPPSFQGYEGDHHKLLVRYMFQLTPEEQRRVSSGLGRAAASPPGHTAPASGRKPQSAGNTTRPAGSSAGPIASR
ncbi:MAG: c-type cytochrome [Candidatus Korobacteraceae bacterium]